MRASWFLGLLLVACGSNGTGSGLEPDGPGPDGGGQCFNLQCLQVSCPGGGTTSVSGTVFTPRGDLPLPNVTVYVPNREVQPFIAGVSCERCGDSLSGSPLVRATTGVDGSFTLENMPAGEDIPLVIQVGRWRRIVTIPAVPACEDTALDAGLTRLPRTRMEGDIPRIALTTGGADALECLLRKVGIADSEFTPESGPGRVNLFAGRDGAEAYAPGLNEGVALTPAPTWWEHLENLAPYDIVLHSCEGYVLSENKSPQARQALMDYTSMGGRVFASHLHHDWFQNGPEPWSELATWQHQPVNPPDPMPASIDMSSERGAMLAEWLMVVGGSSTLGQLAIHGGRRVLTSVDSPLVRRWIYNDDLGSTQYFAFNTPVDVAEEQQCGRVVFSDIHVSTGPGVDISDVDHPFPSGCTSTEMRAQEQVLVFMLFDISACIQPDDLVK